MNSKASSRALEVSEARLRAIFDTSHLYQGLLAPDGKVLHANATALHGIASTLDAVVGKPFWETAWFTDTPGMREIVRKAVAAVAGGETVRREMLLNLPAGRRSFDFAMRPIRDEQGAIVGLVPEAVDITERRQAEEALRQSQKMEAVGQLTGGLAHDFNNLLTGVIGSLELLQARIGKAASGDLERYITMARSSAERAAALTHRLLAFARRQTLDAKPVDVDQLVAGMEELVRRTMGPQIAVEVICRDALWAALVDPNQLENALLNLCINARDAMPDGGRLTIETSNISLDERAAREQELPAGQFLSLCVSDTGTGMTPDVIERAFDPFFTTKPIGEGTGLGLSMIYGFARQSGGQVRICSEPGRGAAVRLYLPRHDSAESPAHRAVEPGEPRRAEDGETVLVIDDEPAVRMLVVEVLSDLGYTAIEAPTGTAGLRVLQSGRRVDLVVTDVGLPGGMNGRQLADAGRVLRPGLKVLFITGYAESAAIGDGRLGPGMQVLTKPFGMRALASRIRSMIAES
jgi:PAS domain S-box-containing protein